MGWGAEMDNLFKGHKLTLTDHQTETVDSHIKFCEKCRGTWERYLCGSSRGFKIMYHGNHIPSIGKGRKDCPLCVSESTNETFEEQGV
tara:strand:- start:355 stop:618 length:264 start_codon:yes stop_codon:yes gene_type:complete